MLSLRFGARSAPPPALPALRRALSTSSQVTPPAAVVSRYSTYMTINFQGFGFLGRAARSAPPPALPALRRALSTSSQVTPPAAVVSRYSTYMTKNLNSQGSKVSRAWGALGAAAGAAGAEARAVHLLPGDAARRSRLQVQHLHDQKFKLSGF